MKKHEFTKYEIATYLRDYNTLMIYALLNQDASFYDLFKRYMANDGRIQYSITDYYYEMISVYEMLLVSKFMTMLYDNHFEKLNDARINELSIPDDIFINSKDRTRFSKRQIIINIRNAFNHNDNPNHDLLKFVRINEEDKEKVKVEILLKNTKPVPFHIMLDIEQLIKICFEIKNSNTILIASNRSLKPISLNSTNVSETLDNIYLRKFYSRKKLTDEQKELLTTQIENVKETKGIESVLLSNGMEYRDFRYSTAQKLKVEEDLKYWESLGESGNDVIYHLLEKIMPFSYLKNRAITMNLILSNYYVRSGKSIFDLVRDARSVWHAKTMDKDSPLYLYVKGFGKDDNILYDAIDFENIASITNAIYYGYLFDTLITDDDIKINDTKTIKREKIRDSFVHMRWYKGINECFKLFDWDNGIDNEYNKLSDGFWSSNIKLVDLMKCSESYFKSCLAKKNNNESYMEFPIHFKSDYFNDRSNRTTAISFIKNGVFYYLDISSVDDNYDLLVCDDSQIQRTADDAEKVIFIDELNNLSEKEKNDFREIIEKIKIGLLQPNIYGVTKK